MIDGAKSTAVFYTPWLMVSGVATVGGKRVHISKTPCASPAEMVKLTSNSSPWRHLRFASLLAMWWKAQHVVLWQRLALLEPVYENMVMGGSGRRPVSF